VFRIPQVNVIESDEGFSVEVEMTRLLYTEGHKKLYMSSEILAVQEIFWFPKNPFAIGIHHMRTNLLMKTSVRK
jgi:hypothetical protein